MKRLQKKLLLLSLTAIMVFVPFFQASAVNITDTKGHWAEAQISDWASKGLVKGYSDGSFKPDGDITRAEFMAMVNRVFNFSKTSAPASSDVSPSDWFASDVAKARAQGYITGYPDGTVKPLKQISRQEAATILGRILKLKASEGSAGKFSDAGSIAAWSGGYIGAIVRLGYMKGYPDNTFRPEQNATRAEIVAVLSKAAGALYNAAGTYGPATGTDTVDGNVTIAKSDITLKNVVISGNLYLTEGIGDGAVTLDNVTVKGTTTVSGGGGHSIVVLNSSLGRVVVDVPDNSKVRLVAQGTTSFQTVETRSAARLEESALAGAGFGEVIIEVPAGAAVELAGDFDTVDVAAAQARIAVLSGTIGRVNVQNEGKGSQITLDSSATIKTLNVNEAATVAGTGKIETANVNAGGVAIAPKPTNTSIAAGVTASVGGETRSGTSTGGGGGGSGGGGTGTITAAQITAATVDINCGSVEFDYDFESDENPVNFEAAKGAPYYLDPAASTVQLSDGTNTSNAVSLDALGLSDEGSDTYNGMDALKTAFGIAENATWIPSRVAVTLKSKTAAEGKTVANPWTKLFTLDVSTDAGVFAINADRDMLMLKDGQDLPVGGAALAAVTYNLTLDGAGEYGSSISWQSSDPSVVETNGAVHRPADADRQVMLTATLSLGGDTLTKEFNVTVLKKQPVLAMANDDTALLQMDGKTPHDIDNFWRLTVFSGGTGATVKDSVYADDITVTGLPDGLSWTLARGDEYNEIRITVTGAAYEAQISNVTVGIIVKASAVVDGEANVTDSGPVEVRLEPSGAGGGQLSAEAVDGMAALGADNRTPDAGDNAWVIVVNGATVSDGVSANDLSVTSMPEGLTITAAKGVGNTIVVTMEGAATEPLTVPATVLIKVKSSAVVEPGFEDSADLPVSIVLP